jgi:hypothetical protein
LACAIDGSAIGLLILVLDEPALTAVCKSRATCDQQEQCSGGNHRLNIHDEYQEFSESQPVIFSW